MSRDWHTSRKSESFEVEQVLTLRWFRFVGGNWKCADNN